MFKTHYYHFERKTRPAPLAAQFLKSTPADQNLLYGACRIKDIGMPNNHTNPNGETCNCRYQYRPEQGRSACTQCWQGNIYTL